MRIFTVTSTFTLHFDANKKNLKDAGRTNIRANKTLKAAERVGETESTVLLLHFLRKSKEKVEHGLDLRNPNGVDK